jgi:Spy/CpxP family protein refolding chaperone
MKIRPLTLFLASAVISSASLFAQDAGSSGSTTNLAAGATDTTVGNDQRGEKWKKAFAQLDLTEAQKSQIKQIRASTSPGKERRQQIMAVLTPAQKEKLVSMIKASRADQGDR